MRIRRNSGGAGGIGGGTSAGGGTGNAVGAAGVIGGFGGGAGFTGGKSGGDNCCGGDGCRGGKYGSGKGGGGSGDGGKSGGKGGGEDTGAGKGALRFKEDIVREVTADFAERRERRRFLEGRWRLNINFFSGNQYCCLAPDGKVEDRGRDYFWQEREVYNHLAPIIETRLAKLGKVRPKTAVQPASGSDEDMRVAKMSTAILNSAFNKLSLDEIFTRATMWSEVCGSAFYKITWNGNAGSFVGELDGERLYEGEAEISVCTPFEIFPDDLCAPSVDACRSLIHAKVLSTDVIRETFGVSVAGEKAESFNLSGAGLAGGLGAACAVPAVTEAADGERAVVIERYTAPSAAAPDGTLEIVAGGELLYYGALPYRVGADGARAIPFIKQDSVSAPGSFFGASVLDRTIPVQRAYNAVKNRKHEFLNRIAMGVLAVEDGSVDTDNLEEEGLSPGKILVYRQGSRPPQMMDAGRVPPEFSNEEDRLLNEFMQVSGVSEIMRNSHASSVQSGVALQMLIEQDDTRLSVTAELIRKAVKKTGEFILRLYKQFASVPRLSKIIGNDGRIELLSWRASDISSDDVIFLTENELSDSPSSRRSMLFELLKAGLMHDENGKLKDDVRVKILDMLGYGMWEYSKDLESLHLRRAEEENITLASRPVEISDVDDHALHAVQHKKYMLGADFNERAARSKRFKERFDEHLKAHAIAASLTEGMKNGENADG